MIKSALILMLVTTQLLAGSGGSVYLCISNDGSFYCLDAGPSTCSCGTRQATSLGDADDADKDGCSCCSHCRASKPHNERDLAPITELSSSEDSSGCTHILLSHDQGPSQVARSTSAADMDRLLHLAGHLRAVTPMLSVIDCGCSLRERFWLPAIPSQTMAVLSSVLIQC